MSRRISKIEWLSTIVSYSTPNTNSNTDNKTFTVRLRDIENQTKKSRETCKKYIKETIAGMVKAGITITCPDIKTREEIQEEKERAEKEKIHFSVSEIVDVKKLLPESFGKYIKGNGQLFLTRAMEYLKDYKPINIGVVTRYKRLLQTGRIVQLGNKNSPFYAIFNVRHENKMVDLIYYNGNIPCGIEEIITVTEKRANYKGREILQKNPLVRNKTGDRKEIVRSKKFDDNSETLVKYSISLEKKKEERAKKEEYQRVAKDKRQKVRNDKREEQEKELADLIRRVNKIAQQKEKVAQKEKVNV